jgi:hypothetical protein
LPSNEIPRWSYFSVMMFFTGKVYWVIFFPIFNPSHR